MNLIQSILLGIVQGLTEFLPVSSSAHLVLVPYWLRWDIPEDQVFVFGVLVQMGTLLAVIIYFWKDLVKIITSAVKCLVKGKPFKEKDARLGWLVVLATIPAGLAGLFLKDMVEQAFQSPLATAGLLLVTALFLFLAEWLGRQQKNLTGMTWLDALVIGIFQAISIFPGVSRSGSTITGGLLLKLDRTSAARFSFLMSIPVMAAAGVLAVGDLLQVANLPDFMPVMVAGVIAAAVTGFLSIKWLLGYLRSHSLVSFAIYCIIVFAATLTVHLLRG